MLRLHAPVSLAISFTLICAAAPPPAAHKTHSPTRPAVARKRPAVPVPPPAFYRVTLDTTKGPVLIDVTRDWSPNGADRFYKLVKDGFYDGARFFRIVPGFVVQFGIPGNPDFNRKWSSTIADDPVKQSNTRGYVSFAKLDRKDSRTTQVFFNLGDNARLDAMGFAPFGLVSSGMEIVEQFNSEYGEEPDQKQAEREGNAYLQKDFPNLDYIRHAKVEKLDGPPSTP